MIALTLAAALLAGEPATAFDRACMDDNGRDLCEPSVAAKIRARTDAEPAEALLAGGARGVRVFLIDGYGRDMPVVSVLSRGAEPPKLEIRAAVLGRGAVTMTADPDPWTRRIAEVVAEQTLASPERDEPRRGADPKAPPAICLHAWMAIVEVVGDGKVTRRVRSACGDEPVFDGASYLGQLALRSQEGCHALSEVYGGEVGKLAPCATLAGKVRWGDVWLRNRFDELARVRPGRAENGPSIDGFFTPDAVIIWPGESEKRGAKAAAFWSERRATAGLVGNLVVATPAPQEGGEVRGYVIEREGKARRQAAFVQTWLKGKDGRLRLSRWVVEPFAAYTRED